ncbi:hypothetical protein HBH64_143160 [Parastagonospora nodorum]|nr:hypothetical protein HBH83_096450 [Parastagonospora nodorum]KAH4744723.1 hypothetical protein HBH64_143160 [Parastagonospora nodorum]
MKFSYAGSSLSLSRTINAEYANPANLFNRVLRPGMVSQKTEITDAGVKISKQYIYQKQQTFYPHCPPCDRC